jgi:hypothetical protein
VSPSSSQRPGRGMVGAVTTTSTKPSTKPAPSLPELRDRIVLDLTRALPTVPPDELRLEVEQEMQHFADAPVTQYVPVLVGRAVKAHHR